MKQCDGWPNPGCTNDATNVILGYEFCDHCARAYMPTDSPDLRADLAAAHEAIRHILDEGEFVWSKADKASLFSIHLSVTTYWEFALLIGRQPEETV